MNLKRRWYDSYNETTKVFDILQKLDDESKRRLSADLTEIVKQIKELHREEEEPVLSLGIDRVIGLYQQSVNERRWYDTNTDLKYALKTMSTLPTEDFLNIMEGLAVSLND
jgi:Mg/Co/Ni transporter MgtE